ncbi:Exo-poly-alpha-D-galacturonosidase precursor [Solibacillus isronensis B3W22]|uniref:Exo-poly-alpha-D-galacturonosidase n=1 Tax=Solibacillus isronensis B3W22 TaxID=1224748 RepID=K1LHS5_9BACL|nr:glycoside hydrolase family 28 protein [Solibacillus isronensis]AMO85307.1 endopolygalacturonase [Solibacillus silvestris]EKB44039.1 Exo-poly-alpha-D-galacturonosidase precursor [Solibacillus isronensis B3W22]
MQHSSAVYNIEQFGAVGDGWANNTSAIKRAVEACSQGGGGTVYVPAGVFVTGAIELKSNMHLHLEAGSELLFSNDREDYPVISSRWEGASRDVYMSCIYACHAKNIAITGFGTLNGQGAYWWKLFKEDALAYPRPNLVSFDHCERVHVEQVKMIDSPSWTVHPNDCDNVTISAVSIVNPANSPNTDGINPESCRNVRISDCSIDVGDDCIAIKSGTEDAERVIPCENITITNCTMLHGHGGVVFGSEMSGDIRNVVVSNCIFEGTDRGIRFKSRRGRGGTIENIRVNNIVMNNIICPFILNLYYYHGPRGMEPYVSDKEVQPVTALTPKFRHIHFSNITATDVTAAAGFMYGLPEMPVEDITFSHIRIAMKPDAEPDLPAMMVDLEPMKQRGFFCSNAEDVLFEHVTVQQHEGPAFEITNSKNVVMEHCRSKDTVKDEMLVQMSNVRS